MTFTCEEYCPRVNRSQPDELSLLTQSPSEKDRSAIVQPLMAQVGRVSGRDDRRRHAYGIVSCRGGIVSVFGRITVMTPS